MAKKGLSEVRASIEVIIFVIGLIALVIALLGFSNYDDYTEESLPKLTNFFEFLFSVKTSKFLLVFGILIILRMAIIIRKIKRINLCLANIK